MFQCRRRQRRHRQPCCDVIGESETGSGKEQCDVTDDITTYVTNTSSVDGDVQWNAISGASRRPSVVCLQDSFTTTRFDVYMGHVTDSTGFWLRRDYDCGLLFLCVVH